MTLDQNEAHNFDVEVTLTASDFMPSLDTPNAWVLLLRGARTLVIKSTASGAIDFEVLVATESWKLHDSVLISILAFAVVLVVSLIVYYKYCAP
jgi:hypothetical protein